MLQQTNDLAPAIVVFDIDGVVRDVGGSYRRALADTVEHFTAGAYRPTQSDIDHLKSEGIWNNDWEGSQELIYRYFEDQKQPRTQLQLDYQAIVAFFQSRYRGLDPQNWTGYICNEPLLLQPSYLEQLSASGIAWGFFSGATRASATYVLRRLGLHSPVLIAMEDAPSKPDPTGLLATVNQLEQQQQIDSSILMSAVSVAVVQGLLTLVGVVLGSVVPDAHIAALTATGGLMLVGIALRLLRVREVPVGDMLPALLAPSGVVLVVSEAAVVGLVTAQDVQRAVALRSDGGSGRQLPNRLIRLDTRPPARKEG